MSPSSCLLRRFACQLASVEASNRETSWILVENEAAEQLGVSDFTRRERGLWVYSVCINYDNTSRSLQHAGFRGVARGESPDHDSDAALLQRRPQKPGGERGRHAG